MKAIFYTLIILISTLGSAQDTINYKAIIKDGNGNVVADDLIVVQFAIHETTENGTIVYQESHTPTTDSNGLVVLGIGEGTPISGIFATIDWASDNHFLNVQINLGGGLVDIGTTQFAAVPYAYAARTASNVFSGDFNDLINVPNIGTPTGLEQITEDGDTGWRLIGKDPDNYGDIGANAVDLSQSTISSSTRGATTLAAFAAGTNTTASGFSSVALGSGTEATTSNATALGNSTVASGVGSLSAGFNTSAASFYSTALGRYNVGGGDPTSWDEDDPLFEIGNGTNDANRNNALTITKGGRLGLNRNSGVSGMIHIDNEDLASASIWINHEENTNTFFQQYGIFIDLDKNDPASTASAQGVWARVINDAGTSIGLYGFARSAATSTADAYGVRAVSDNDNGTGVSYALYATLNASTTSGARYAGFFDGSVFTTGVYLPSDQSLKSDIKLAKNSALEKLLNLPVENYTYKNDIYKDFNLPEGFRTGFTAQNVEKVMPELVKKATRPAPTKEEIEDGAQPVDDIHFKAVDYSGMVPYLVKAIQELKQENEALKTRIEAIENK